MKLTIDELVAAVEALSPEQKIALARRIRLFNHNGDQRLTRDQALAELEALRAAGAFADAPSLMGKYAGQGIEITAEELAAALDEAATAWEDELDELDGDGH